MSAKQEVVLVCKGCGRLLEMINPKDMLGTTMHKRDGAPCGPFVEKTIYTCSCGRLMRGPGICCSYCYSEYHESEDSLRAD